ncbi:hypothetical protein KSF78_0001365 [Schistosoma japonicum]|nr:hypothetical protein KSF78_0001365 [Schistosoma japonicum]
MSKGLVAFYNKCSGTIEIASGGIAYFPNLELYKKKELTNLIYGSIIIQDKFVKYKDTKCIWNAFDIVVDTEEAAGPTECVDELLVDFYLSTACNSEIVDSSEKSSLSDRSIYSSRKPEKRA